METLRGTGSQFIGRPSLTECQMSRNGKTTKGLIVVSKREAIIVIKRNRQVFLATMLANSYIDFHPNWVLD